MNKIDKELAMLANARLIKELLDQSTILLNNTNTEDIAKYLSEANVVALPIGVGDTAYFLSVKTPFDSLLSNGVVVKRIVDSVSVDEKGIIIKARRESYNDPCGNLYEYYGERVYDNIDAAENALAAIKSAFSKKGE